MNRISRVKAFKYQLQTVCAVLLILKLSGEITLNCLIVLSPLLLLLLFELLPVLAGLIIHYINSRKL